MKIVYVLAVLAVLAVSASEARRNRGCRYSKKAKWSDCDPVTKTKTRTLQPKPNNQPDCNTPRVQTRSCSVCQYGPPELGPCDPVNRTMEIRKPLLPGTPDQGCEAFKIKVKRCKVKLNCQYGERVIGDCNTETNTMVISFPLLPGQDPMCPPKNKTKACKKMKNKVRCKYDKSSSEWDTSACPGGSATRVLTLKTNQDETLCPPTKEVSVPCRKHEKKMKRKTKKENKKQRKQRRRQNRKNAGAGSADFIDENE